MLNIESSTTIGIMRGFYGNAGNACIDTVTAESTSSVKLVI